MKKILSLVLAIMMVLSMATVAFAAPEDVTDKNQQKAVDALISLGIVKGYEDGSYKPEKTVTRAELAKMLVEALGQGGLVAGSESSFKDAKGTWYDGYVALAAGLELVTGYPDGTFKGENSVSYQEAVVMIIRALGYTNATVNNGVDAYNATKYRTLAQSLGVLKNVTFLAGGANRGDIASMIYNSLEVHRVRTNEKGLAEKIVTDELEVPVVGRPGVTRKEYVYESLLTKLTDYDVVQVTTDHLNPKHKDYLGDAVDLEPYMYQSIVAYLNKVTGHVMFVKGSLSPTVKGNVSALLNTDVQWVGNPDNNQNKIFVKLADKSIERVKFGTTTSTNTIKVYFNGGETTGTILDFQRGTYGDGYDTPGATNKFNGAVVTLVLNPNTDEVVAAVARKVTATRQIKQAYKAGTTALITMSTPLNLPKTITGKMDTSKIIVKGDVTSLEDITAKDVVNAYYAKGDSSTGAEKVELVVCRDVIEGRITKTDLYGYKTINGEAYLSTGVTLNIGDEGKFYLDARGVIAGFEGKSISNNNYAFIRNMQTGVTGGSTTVLLRDANISLLSKEGVAKSYNFATNAQYRFTSTTGANGPLVDVFSSKLYQQLDSTFAGYNTKDGQYIVTGFNTNEAGQIILIYVRELTMEPFDTRSKTFAVSDDAIVYNSYNDATIGTGINTFKVANADDLVKASQSRYAVLNNKGEFELIIVSGSQLVDDRNYAIIVDSQKEYTDNGIRNIVTAYVKGEKIEYLTSVGVTISSSIVDVPQLYQLPLTNGVIAQSMTNSPVGTTATATAISNGTISVSDLRLARGAAIYVFTQTTTDAEFYFTRVGDDSDLTLSNADFNFYNLDGIEGYEVVIIKVKR